MWVRSSQRDIRYNTPYMMYQEIYKNLTFQELVAEHIIRAVLVLVGYLNSDQDDGIILMMPGLPVSRSVTTVEHCHNLDDWQIKRGTGLSAGHPNTTIGQHSGAWTAISDTRSTYC